MGTNLTVKRQLLILKTADEVYVALLALQVPADNENWSLHRTVLELQEILRTVSDELEDTSYNHKTSVFSRE